MTNYVVCLKWGTKYSPEYVNRLHSMVERNITLPYTFVCFTDTVKGISENIQTHKLPDIGVPGWWNKLWFLSSEFPLNGTVLFLDLDVVVFESLDKFFEYNPGEFCIIRDFTRQQIASWRRMNSSVFRFESHQHADVYDRFIKNKHSFTTRYQGDQDYIYDQIKSFKFWPDDWVMSYKWEMRDRSQLVKTPDGLNFPKDAAPVVKPDTAISVFHGKPNPHECKDSWVVQHWR